MSFWKKLLGQQSTSDEGQKRESVNPDKTQEAMTWVRSGHNLRANAAKEEAIRCFDKALEIDPECLLAWVEKGGCLAYLYRYEEALPCFVRALEIDPQDAEAWYGKAEAEDKLGRREAAVNSYRQFLALASSEDEWDEIAISDAQQRLQELE